MKILKQTCAPSRQDWCVLQWISDGCKCEAEGVRNMLLEEAGLKLEDPKAVPK